MIAYPEGRERRREARRLGEGSRGRREVHGKGKGFGRALFIRQQASLRVVLGWGLVRSEERYPAPGMIGVGGGGFIFFR